MSDDCFSPVTPEATIVMLQERLWEARDRLALLVRRLEALDQYAYPDGPRVIVNGDDWRGQLVVRWADVQQIIRDTKKETR